MTDQTTTPETTVDTPVVEGAEEVTTPEVTEEETPTTPEVPAEGESEEAA